jgi:ABC-2 type transport system ATP-binding protein
MAEAEALCDRVAIINDGRVIACDSPENLKKLLNHEAVYQVETDLILEPSNPFGEIGGIRRFGAEHKANAGTTRFQVIMDHDAEVSTVTDRIEQMGKRVRTVIRTEPSLEDVFLHLVGHMLSDEDQT